MKRGPPAQRKPTPLLESRGPKYMALAPQHRRVVDYYVEGYSRTDALRLAGYQDGDPSTEPEGRGTGAGLRAQASRMFKRQDIADAVLEQMKQRWGAALAEVGHKIEDMALRGRTVQYLEDGKPPIIKDLSPETQLKALTQMQRHGGMHEVTETNVNVTVKTDADKMRELIQMRDQGLIPPEMLEGITLTDAEYEVVDEVAPTDEPQIPDELKDLL